MQPAVMICLKLIFGGVRNAYHVGSILERDERKIQVHGNWIVGLQPPSYVTQ